jgi:hypothetical protein
MAGGESATLWGVGFRIPVSHASRVMCAHKQCISIPQGTLTTRKSTSDIICRVSQTPPDRSPLAYALAESLSCSPCRCQGPLFLTVCHLKPALSLFTSSLNTSELLQPGRHRFIRLLAAPPPAPALLASVPSALALWHRLPPRTPWKCSFGTGVGRCPPSALLAAGPSSLVRADAPPPARASGSFGAGAGSPALLASVPSSQVLADGSPHTSPESSKICNNLCSHLIAPD